MIKSLLAHPLTKGRNLDDPQTTWLRRQIIREKAFLRQIYTEWYSLIAARVLPLGQGFVEIGSGAGFLQDYIPGLITSELFYCPGVRLICDGQQMPLRSDSIQAVILVDVLHHLPSVRSFFSEASRCVESGGKILMIEPWVTAWSSFVYKHFHYEPFAPEAENWSFPPAGPLSGANEALPWIIFQRDREQFESEFPEWKVKEIVPMMPFRYLASGGIATRTIMPGWSFKAWAFLEKMLRPWNHYLAMFALIELEKSERASMPTMTV